ncbi:MAG: hypothetical protein Q9181_006876 [Wetmoreana brouardii]
MTSKEAHALFDILTSHVTLSEIENLKYPKTIATFGPPLQPSATLKTSSPLLRILLQSFILDLPGLRNVTSHFWTDSINRLTTALDDANLSQSYDKGCVGIRRTLSTAVASIVESVSRGRLGGYPKQSLKQDGAYDRTNPDDVVKAWDDFLQRIIYGDLLDKMFVKAAETDKLSDHEPVVQAAHQYALIMIISQVLTADITEMRKRVKQIEQSMDALEKPQIDLLRKYPSRSSKEQQKIRSQSESRSISIVTAILSTASSALPMSESTHKLALDYLSLHLAIRDREQLIQVLCHHSPDFVTTSIRELVAVYDPIIRALHKAVDLGSGVTDLQNFLDDLIALSQLDKAKASKVPTIQDFVHLLQKHQGSSHVFIHQALKNGKELSEWYHEYASHAVEQYKQFNGLPEGEGTAAGDFTAYLNDLVFKLPEDERHTVLEQIDRHAAFLDSLAQRSKDCMDATVRASLASEKTNTKSTENELKGSPGMFLLKWQHFIDSTTLTPGSSNGAPRTGKSQSVRDATAVDVEGNEAATTRQVDMTEKAELAPPNVGHVLRRLEPGFKEELRRMVDVRKGKGGGAEE